MTIYSERARQYKMLQSYASVTLTSTLTCVGTVRYTNARAVLRRQVVRGLASGPAVFFFSSRFCVHVK